MMLRNKRHSSSSNYSTVEESKSIGSGEGYAIVDSSSIRNISTETESKVGQQEVIKYSYQSIIVTVFSEFISQRLKCLQHGNSADKI